MSSNQKICIENIVESPKIIIPILATIGIILRLYIFPYEIPFSLDSLDLFTYAVKTNQIGQVPIDFALDNNGWPLFVSAFFNIVNSDNFFDLVHLQRFLSLSFSVLTIIPIYYLSRKFFNNKFALIAVSLFIFDFRLIIDSIGGGNMPIFIFLMTSGICLFILKPKMVYFSFILVALSSIIRYEGLLIFIPFTIMYLIKYKKEKSYLLKYGIAIFFAILIIFPIALIRIENTGSDGFVSGFSAITSYYNHELLTGYSAQCPYVDPDCSTKMINDEEWTKPGKDNVTPFIISGITGLVKYFSLNAVPIFFLFLIPSIILIIKKQNFRKISFDFWTLIFSSLFLIFPAFYAYGRHFEETRYLFIIFPLLCIFCLNGLNFKKFNDSKIVFFIIIGIILVISFGAITYKDVQLKNEYEREVFIITEYIAKNIDGINYFNPESQFMKSADAYDKWPETLDIDESRKSHVKRITNLISTDNYNSLEEFILDSESKGLTHLYVDGNDFRNKIENDVFYNEDNFPYLFKQYDSKNYGLSYHVKIFKIDFQKLKNADI